jgi:ribosome-associated heat shock protein Hsp15
MPSGEIRIDKFLWAVRLYKTRSIAAEACRSGKIIINSIQVKPSYIIKGKETIIVKKLPVVYTYEVLEPVGNRVSAKSAGDFIRDLTPEEEKNKLSIAKNSGFGYRPRGYGRPTKKERRTIDKIHDNLSD